MFDLAPVQTVPPTDMPVSLFEARAHLRVDGQEEDVLIAALIEAAVSHLDGWSGILGRCIMQQTWRQDLAWFPCEVRLPFPDVQSVVIQYVDVDGATQTFPSGSYHLINTISGGMLCPKSGHAWPSVGIAPDAVKITMVCGYNAVPAGIKQAILLHVGAMFENRSSMTEAALMPFAYDALIAPHRRVGT